MALSIDKIRKLIELACNNNSELEANRAARKVCQEIKDSNFKLLNSSFNPDSPPTRPVYEPTHRQRRYADPFSDLYETIRRTAAEAAERERTRTEDLYERIKRANEEARKRTEESERKEREAPKYTQKENAPKWNWGYNPSDAQKDFWNFDDTFYRRTGAPKDTRPSKERECSKCGGKVKTFRIKEEPFVCNVCQWSHWEKER